MQRIIILGSAGTGKTTFARRLVERTGVALIDLDAIWRAQGDGDVKRFRETMLKAHAGEAWISDGNFAAATFDIRLPRADQIVWLEAPRLLSAWRATTRVFRPGEPHKLADLGKALAFIRRFDRVNRPLIERERAAHGPDVPVVHLAAKREADAFIEAAPHALLPREKVGPRRKTGRMRGYRRQTR